MVVKGDIARVTKRDNQLPESRFIFKRSPNARLSCQQHELAKNCLCSTATGSGILLRKELAETLKTTCSARRDN